MFQLKRVKCKGPEVSVVGAVSRVKGAGGEVTEMDHARPCRVYGPCKGHRKNTGDYCVRQSQRRVLGRREI